jgi:hypothetical protein
MGALPAAEAGGQATDSRLRTQFTDINMYISHEIC